MSKISNPTDSELEILQILWKSGPSTVKDVNQKLSVQKEVGYTTTLKQMQIMAEKNLLKRKKEGRSHIYIPVPEETDIKNSMLEKIIDTAFSGSASNLMMQLLKNKKTLKSELAKIRELIKNYEGSGK